MENNKAANKIVYARFIAFMKDQYSQKLASSSDVDGISFAQWVKIYSSDNYHYIHDLFDEFAKEFAEGIENAYPEVNPSE